MAQYPQPEPFTEIFNNNNYYNGSTSLSLNDADDRYLKLTGGIITGSLTANNNLSLTGSLTYNGSTADLDYLTLITPGTALAEKALVLDSNRRIGNIERIDLAPVGTSIPFRSTKGTNIFHLYQAEDSASYIGNTGNGDLHILTSNTTQLVINGTNGNIAIPNTLQVAEVDVQSHNGTIGLSLGGSLVESTATELNYLSGVSPGTVSNEKALITNSNKEIALMKIKNNNTVSPSSFNEDYKLSIRTGLNDNDGSASVGLAFMVSSNVIDTTPSASFIHYRQNTFGVGDFTFNLRRGTSIDDPLTEIYRITASNGYMGINTTTPSYQLDIDGSLNSTSLYLNGTQLSSSATELNYLSGITPGTALADKALVLDSNRDIVDINELTMGRYLDLSSSSSGQFIRTKYSNTGGTPYSMEAGIRGSTASPPSCYYWYSNAYCGFINSNRRWTIGSNIQDTYKLEVDGNCNLTGPLFMNGTEFIDSNLLIHNDVGVEEDVLFNFRGIGADEANISFVTANSDFQFSLNNAFNTFNHKNSAIDTTGLNAGRLHSKWTSDLTTELQLSFGYSSSTDKTRLISTGTASYFELGCGSSYNTCQLAINSVSNENNVQINKLYVGTSVGTGSNIKSNDASLNILGRSEYLTTGYNDLIIGRGTNASPVELLVQCGSGSSSTTTNAVRIGSKTNNDLSLLVNSTPRLTIEGGTDRVLINSGSLYVLSSSSYSLSGTIYYNNTQTGAITSELGPLSKSLSIYTTAPIRTPGLYTSSDLRLKENIEPLEDSTDKILNLDLIRFNYKKDNNKNKYIGVIAQQLLENDLTDLLNFENDESMKFGDYSPEGVAMSVDYTKMTVYLLQIIQKQEKRLNQLESLLS